MAPVFFRITVGLFALLVLLGVLMAVALVLNADRINGDGGSGWLMAIFVFVAATAVVCAVAAVTSAVSIWRGEAHRRLSIGILILCCFVAGTFGSRLVVTGWSQLRQSQEAPRQSRAQPPRASQDAGSEVSDDLIEHFRVHGFVLRPAVDWRTSREWRIEFTGVGPRCNVLTKFRGFARGIPVELMKKRMMEYNAASVLNEQAALAMFLPHARGTTPDKDDCEAWPAKSPRIVEPLLKAFMGYRP